MILFLKKYYKAKIFDSFYDLFKFYGLNDVKDIKEHVDVLAWDMLKKPYKIADIIEDKIIFNYNDKNEITDYFFSCSGSKVNFLCVRLFIKDGEKKLLDEIKRYEKKKLIYQT